MPGGAASSREANLTVIVVSPSILSQPRGESVPVGTTYTFTTTAEGTEPLNYQWRLNGVDIGGETQASLSLSNLTPAHSGDYTVVVSNVGGSVTSSSASLAVLIPPVITRQPQGTEVLTGTSVAFELTASGTEPLSYQWEFNGTPIDGAVGRSLNLADVTADAAGDYGVTVTNGAGSATSGAATLAVVQSVVITAEPQAQTVTVGEGANFNVTATGTDPMIFQWQFGGVNIDGATDATLSLASVQAVDGGAYQVVVSNVAGPVKSAPAILTVNVGVVILDQPQSVTVTSGGSAAFTVLASGTPAPAYQWRLDGNDLAGATGPSLSVTDVTPAKAGVYSVTVQNAVGTVTSADAILTVIVPPSIQTQPQSQTVDLATSVTFGVVAVGDAPLSYQWQKNGGNIAGATADSFTIGSVQASDAGSYGVVVENPGGAATSDSAVLTVNLPPLDSGNSAASVPPPIEDTSGSFDGGSNASGGGQIARRNAPPATGGERWYAWRAPVSGIATFDTAGSTFDTVLSIYTGTPDALALIATDDDRGGFLTSKVRFNTTVGTTYLINVKGFGNAAGQIVVSFNLDATSQQVPVITVSPQSVTAVVGKDVSFMVVAEGTDLVYQWLGDGTEITGESSATLQLLNVQEADALSYSVRITSATVAVDPVSVESLPALLHVGTVNSLSVDKFLNAPRLAGGIALQRVDRTPSPESLSVLAGSPIAEGFNGSISFSTFGASKEQGEPNHCDVVGGASQWMTYMAPEAGVVRVSTEGADFDTVLSVYSGTGSSFDGLILEACDDNSGADGMTSIADFRVRAGAQYFIAVDGVGGSRGTVKLSYEFAKGPEISTQPQSVSVSVGEQVVLSVQTADPAGGAVTIEQNYQWTKDGFPIFGQTANDLVFSSVALGDTSEYAVIVSNFAGSTTSDGVRLDVSVPLSITAQPANQSVNAGDSVNLSVVASGSEPISYQWQFEGADVAGATAATYPITSAQASDGGVYVVIVSNPIGAVTSDPAALSLIQAPLVLTHPQDQTVQSGENIVFAVAASGTQPVSYQWRLNGVDVAGAVSSSIEIVDVDPISAGSYSVVISNIVRSVISDTAVLTVNVPLAIHQQPSSITAIPGSVATFTVGATGTGPLGYQWRFDGAELPGATEPTLTLVNVETDEVGIYEVEITDASGSITSQEAQLILGGGPVIVIQPLSQLIRAKSQVTFSVNAEGTEPFRYQWQLNGVVLAGATKAVLVVPEARAVHLGAYRVTVQNDLGTAISDPATLTFLDPVRIVEQPDDQVLPIEGTAKFSVRATGSPELQYQWFFENSTILGATEPSLSLREVHESNEGNYWVRVSNPVNSVKSRVARLCIDPQDGTVRIVSVRMLEDQMTSRVLICGPVGSNGFLQSSMDFRSWTMLNDFTFESNLYEYFDREAGNFPRRFYRVAPPQALRIVEQATDQAIPLGESTTFSVVASGAGPINYQWQHNGADISGATNAVLNLTSVSQADEGSYKVRIENPVKKITSEEVHLCVRSSDDKTVKIVSARMLTGGKTARVLVCGPLGVTGIVHRSRDLKTWVPMGTVTFASTFAEYFDQEAGEDSWRFYKIAPTPPNIKKITQTPDGHLTVETDGGEGFKVFVSVSTKLAEWTVISTNVVSEGKIEFDDPQAGDRQHRFYKIGIPRTD